MPDRFAGLILATAFLLFSTASVAAEDRWTKFVSPHFTMYADTGESGAVETLRTFEEARDFFARNSASKQAPDVAVEIVAFKSRKQAAPYMVNTSSAAYYQRGYKCDYIVMQQLGRDYLPAAIHEYTHLFVEHAGLHLPLWLNEGIADVYSSLREKGGKLVVGEPPKARLNALRAMGPLDVHALIHATRDSPYYTKTLQMAQFYATSWELAHMLLLGSGYRPKFPQFLDQVSGGKPVEQAFADIYRKNLDDVNADLRNYLASNSITVSLFNERIEEDQLRPEISHPPSLETDLVLADLLSTHPPTAPQAEAQLTKLESELPTSPDIEESLAYLEWRLRHLPEARRHFEAAIAKGSKSAQLFYNYTSFLHEIGSPLGEIVPLLERAIALKPDYADARFRLGMEAARDGQCAVTMEALSPLHNVTSDRAYPVFSAEAFCAWRLGNPAEGRRLAEIAKQFAKTPEQSQRAQDLLDQINRLNPLH